MARPTALTMPSVTVRLSWNGLPMARTHSPILSADESPQGTTGRPDASIFTSAMSVAGSEPMMRARTSCRSPNATVISCTRFPTTWLLVTT